MAKEHPAVGIYESNPELSGLIVERFQAFSFIIRGIVRSLDDVDADTRKFIAKGMRFAAIGNFGEDDAEERVLAAETIHKIEPEIILVGLSTNGSIKGVSENYPNNKKGIDKAAKSILQMNGWR
jgi:hypothetical protein